jgi:hypothetical protein
MLAWAMASKTPFHPESTPGFLDRSDVVFIHAWPLYKGSFDYPNDDSAQKAILRAVSHRIHVLPYNLTSDEMSGYMNNLRSNTANRPRDFIRALIKENKWSEGTAIKWAAQQLKSEEWKYEVIETQPDGKVIVSSLHSLNCSLR